MSGTYWSLVEEAAATHPDRVVLADDFGRSLTNAQLHDAAASTAAALAERGIASTGSSGLELWVPVEEEATAVRNLMQLGWAVAAGERFRTAAPPGLRVTIAGLKEHEADDFADAMAEALSPASRTSRA